MGTTLLERELKRGSAELLILALLEQRQRHGYELGQLITDRSEGAISFHIASLYPTLYRLEDKALVDAWASATPLHRRRLHRAATIEPARSSRSRLAGILPEARCAARLLRREPGFTMAAILTMALGIGATTTLFSVAYGVLLRPL